MTNRKLAGLFGASAVIALIGLMPTANAQFGPPPDRIDVYHYYGTPKIDPGDDPANWSARQNVVDSERYERLVPEIRAVLAEAIERGGSTLRDFHTNGQSGYFQLDYFVYDRAGLPCRVCETPIKQIVQGQRSTYFCPTCQR